MTAKEAIEKYNENDVKAALFIMGVALGVESTEAYSEASGAKPLFCLPEPLNLTLPQKMDMLTELTNKIPETKGHPLGLALVNAFVVKFPCRK